MAHRYGVLILALTLIGLSTMMLRGEASKTWSRPLVFALALLFASQVAVGALNVWFEFPTALAVSHTVIASLIWSVLTAMAATSLRPLAAAYRLPSHQPTTG